MDEPEEQFIICVRVDTVPIPYRESSEKSCSECNADVWIANSAEISPLVEKGAKIICHVCAGPIMLKSWADGDLEVRTLEPEFQGILDKNKDGIIARMIEDGMMNG